MALTSVITRVFFSKIWKRKKGEVLDDLHRVPVHKKTTTQQIEEKKRAEMNAACSKAAAAIATSYGAAPYRAYIAKQGGRMPHYLEPR